MGFYQAWSHRYLGGAADLVAARAQGRGKREEGRRKDPVPSSLFLLPFSFVGAEYDLFARRGSLRRRRCDGSAHAVGTAAAWVRTVPGRVRASLRRDRTDAGLRPAGCAVVAPGADEPWCGDHGRRGVRPSLGDPDPGGQRGCCAARGVAVGARHRRKTGTPTLASRARGGARERGNEGTRERETIRERPLSVIG